MVKLVDEMFARYVRTQDAEALAFVFEQTAPALARRARRLVGDPRAAEDLVQDLFLSLLAGTVAWDPSRPCRPWLVGALHRRAARWHRNGGRWPLDPLPNGLHGGERSPEQSASDRELLAAVRAAMGALPPASRDVVHRYVELHETPQEIGRALGRAPGTVRVQLHRGLRALRDRLPAGFLALVLAMIVRPAPAAPALPLRRATHALRAGFAIAAAMLVLVAAVRVVASPPVAIVAGASATVRDPDREGGGAAGAEAGAPRIAVDATPSTATARFVFRHADGSPASGVGAMFGPAGHDADFGWQQAVSDTLGMVAIAGLAPGELALTTDRGTDATFVLHAGANPDLIVELPAGVDVAGRVVDADGNAVAHAGLWVAHEPRHPWDGQVVAAADADGRFVLRGMQPMSTFAAKVAGRVPSPQQAVGMAPRRDVLLRIGGPGATASGIVRALDGSPVAGAVVRIARHGRARFLLPGGNELVEMLPSTGVRTDGEGRFECGELPAGRLELCVRAASFATALLPLQIGAGERRDVDVRLRPGCSVRGVVRDSDGNELSHAAVIAHGRARHEWSGVHAARDGTFELAGVAAERIVLEVSADGCVEQEIPLHAPVGAPIDVVLQRIPSLRGRLVTANGGAVVAGEWEVGRRDEQLWDGRSLAPLPLAADGSFDASGGAGGPWFCRPCGATVWLPCSARAAPDGVVAVAVPETPRECKLAIRLDGFTPAQLADARVWLVRDDEVYRMHERPADDGVATVTLPAGDYQAFVVGDAGACPPCFCGTIALRTDAAHTTTAPPAGTLRYGPRAGSRVERWHAFVVDERGMQAPLRQPNGTVALAAGRYTLWASGLTFMTVRGMPLEVRAGEETLVELPLRAGVVRHVAFQLPAGADQATTTVTLRAGGELVLGGEPGLSGRNFDAPADGFCCAAIVLADGAYDLELCCGEARWVGTFAIGGEDGAIEPVIVPLREAVSCALRSR